MPGESKIQPATQRSKITVAPIIELQILDLGKKRGLILDLAEAANNGKVRFEDGGLRLLEVRNEVIPWGMEPSLQRNDLKFRFRTGTSGAEVRFQRLIRRFNHLFLGYSPA